MYHKITQSGADNDYTVSAAQLEKDLITLKKADFTAVFASEVINYFEKGGSLPKKPVLITFDDGHYNNLYFALPLLQKHKMKALINTIGAFSQFSTVSGDHSHLDYSHLTWNQIAKLEKSGVFEIGNHSYNMHNYKPRFGITKTALETDLEYAQNLKNDVRQLQTKLIQHSVKAPVVFAYPFGAYTDDARQILLSEGFKMLLTCNEGVNLLNKSDPKVLHTLKRINRSPKYSTEQLINKCIINN